MRDFEIINDIMEALPEDVYHLTQTAAENFYKYGDKSLLKSASNLSQLTEEEILYMW